MEPRHIVWITLDPYIFSVRSGIGPGSLLAGLLHKFFIEVLEATKVSDDQTEYRTDYRAVQVGVYKDSGSNGPNRRYHVPEPIAAAFYAMNKDLSMAAKQYAEQKEGIGKNLLIQMLKSDIIGEATKKSNNGSN